MLEENATAKYSTIIVLAHEMDERGKINNESESRLSTAVNAFKQKEADTIVTSGWPYRKDLNIAIGNAMRERAVQHYGVPENAILTDTNSRDTVGDAIFTKRSFSIPYGWQRLLVVTSQYHLQRTREIFSFIYGPTYLLDFRGAPIAGTEAHIVSEERSKVAFRETFKGILPGSDNEIFERLRNAHPFYNGTVHPKI